MTPPMISIPELLFSSTSPKSLAASTRLYQPPVGLYFRGKCCLSSGDDNRILQCWAHTQHVTFASATGPTTFYFAPRLPKIFLFSLDQKIYESSHS